MSGTTRAIRLSRASEAVILPLIGGYVDGVGYLHLGGVYVANMSGNSIWIGLHGVRRNGVACCKGYCRSLLCARSDRHASDRHASDRAYSVPATLHAFAREGLAGTVVGEVTPADGGPRYVEGRLSR